MTVQERKRFGELLIEEGRLSDEDLQRALGEQKKQGQKLGQVLFKMGLLSEEVIAEGLGRQLGIPVAKLDDFDLSGDLISLIPRNIAKNCNVIPIERHYNWVRLAMSDPLDIAAMDEVAHFLRLEVLPSVATGSDVNRALERYYGMRPVAKDTEGRFLMEQDASEPAYGKEDQAVTANEADAVEAIDGKLAPIVSSDSEQPVGQPRQEPEEVEAISTQTLPGVTNAVPESIFGLISRALSEEATDIHLQTEPNGGHLRMRVDGKLKMVNSFRGNAPFSLMDEAKNAAGLESLEGPGDGRFDFRDHVSVRVSTCRTINGEKAVLRLVDKGLSSAGLDALGMPADTNERLKKALKQPGGLFLCTGPVGSGKTTTLYSLINYVNAVDKAIITVEYPIEYALDHVAQLRVDSADGLALSEGIRSALRQDPDVCAVGEIREHESAILVVQAALAGVTALTTFCWNDTIGALARLSEIGLEPSLLASSVTCVMGQRLVRKICEGCRETYAPPPPVLESIDVHDTVPLYRGVGCPACRHTGYRGRTAVFEFLFMDDQLRTLIAAGAPRADIERAAQAGGMKTLRENGIAKALLGITTLEEALNRTKTTAQIVK